MPRFAIRTRMAVILTFAIALVVLSNANDWWAGTMLLVAVAAFATAILRAVFLRGLQQAWWTGFALFSSGYLVFALIPTLSPHLGTTQLLDYLHAKVFMGVYPADWNATVCARLPVARSSRTEGPRAPSTGPTSTGLEWFTELAQMDVLWSQLGHLRLGLPSRSTAFHWFSPQEGPRTGCSACSLRRGTRGIVVSAARRSAPMLGRREEVAMSHIESPFRLTSNGYFMEIRGPAWYQKKPWYMTKGSCQKKLCFVATDQALLADVLRQLAERPDCYYVKYSTYQKDGMYLGRCFLMDEHEVGEVWAKYKEHPRLFCSVQDDEFTAPFRPS